jgi:hypothetical protein
MPAPRPRASARKGLSVIPDIGAKRTGFDRQIGPMANGCEFGWGSSGVIAILQLVYFLGIQSICNFLMQNRDESSQVQHRIGPARVIYAVAATNGLPALMKDMSLWTLPL